MSILKLPGLVDVHTHLRVPGGEHKEDFASGTAAALAGGVTTILAMPNTNPPLSTPEVLAATAETARATIHCDVGLYVGASPVVLSRLTDCAPQAIGLKIYLNDTFGPLRVEALPHLQYCFRVWPADKPLAMHAEGQSVAVGIGLAAAYQRSVHFCHISRRDEVELIAAAKERGLPVTCEVTPHHLFLSQVDAQRLGPLGYMRPLLATPDDVAALWEHLGSTIDCIATDHAPHTLAEKQSADPPPGVAGLETTLPLLLTAVADQRLTLEQLQALTSENPRRIFDLPHQADTWVEVDPEAEYVIRNSTLQTKCGWTPFAGRPVRGQVERVVLRGQTVYEHGQILAEPGGGRLLP